MAGSVIKATGMVEFEDSGLVDREPPKGSKWPAEGPHYTRGSTRGGAVPPGAD